MERTIEEAKRDDEDEVILIIHDCKHSKSKYNLKLFFFIFFFGI